MTDILTEIIACKQIEIELQKAAISKEMLINNCNEPMPRISMRASLASSPYGIISEFKRRSPSKGWIKEDAQADTIPPAYEAAGASALSILTDEKYFGGSLKDIRSARPHVQLPILRKDFIIDEYQLYQARIVGADAILLIAAALMQPVILCTPILIKQSAFFNGFKHKFMNFVVYFTKNVPNAYRYKTAPAKKPVTRKPLKIPSFTS